MENRPPLPPNAIKITKMGPPLIPRQAEPIKHQSKKYENFRLTATGLGVMYEVEAASLSLQVKQLVELIEKALDNKYFVLRMRKADQFVFLLPEKQLGEYYSGYPEGTPPEHTTHKTVYCYVERQQ